jgi:hypothetical protein
MNGWGRIGWSLARFIALAVMLLGAWIFVINLANRGYDETWVLAWVLFSGVAGLLGGIAYLLSIDGPSRMRTRSWRVLGWLGLLASATLPHSFTLVVLPAVLLLFPTLFFGYDRRPTLTSS